jgi:hypothetical protein
MDRRRGATGTLSPDGLFCSFLATDVDLSPNFAYFGGEVGVRMGSGRFGGDRSGIEFSLPHHYCPA